MKIKFFVIIAFSLATFFSCVEERKEIKLELPQAPNEINPLKIGDEIPDMELRDVDNNVFSLKEYFSRKPTIMIYYRGGWCLYCNIHLGQVQEIEQELFDLGYQILAVSADISVNLKEILEKHNLHYDMGSDQNLEGAKKLGLAYNAEDLYSKMIDVLEKYSNSKSHILPVPAAFIVDTKGVIQFSYINPNSNIRIAPELLLTAAKVSLELNKKEKE